MNNTIILTGYVGSPDRNRLGVTTTGRHFVGFTIAEKLKGDKTYQYYDCTFWANDERWASDFYAKIQTTQMATVIGKLSTEVGKDGKTYLKVTVDRLAQTTPRLEQGQTASAAQAADDDKDGLPF
jgi:hypothetical protein